MTVNVMSISADRRVLNKVTTTIKTITATPTGEINILYPKLILEYDSTILNANYCYIPNFNRYYYLSITLDKGKRMILNCSVDVLKTYATQIKNRQGTILRSESIGKPTIIPDNKLPINPNIHDVKLLKFFGANNSNIFADEVSKCSYIMSCVGNLEEQIIIEGE